MNNPRFRRWAIAASAVLLPLLFAQAAQAISLIKVREVYADGDDLLLVASDRVSIYDVILPTPVPGKGRVLTQLSLWWFDRLADIVPNHALNAPFGGSHAIASRIAAADGHENEPAGSQIVFQNSCRRSMRRSGALPAMIAALIAPIDTPVTALSVTGRPFASASSISSSSAETAPHS